MSELPRFDYEDDSVIVVPDLAGNPEELLVWEKFPPEIPRHPNQMFTQHL